MTLWLDYWTQYLNTLKDAPVETPVEHPNTHNTFLRGGGYNCRVNRSGAVVKTFVAKMMKTRDFLTLSEAHQYIGNLRYIPNTQLVAYPGEHQAGEVAIIVRDGVTVSEAAIDRRFTETWPRKDGGQHSPRVLVSAKLNGLARVAAIHVPPAGHDRIKARAEYLAGLAAWCHDHPGPLVLSGDWNYNAQDPKIRGLAHVTGMNIHGSGGIDFALARGVDVLHMRHGYDNGGSDHFPILYRVTPK